MKLSIIIPAYNAEPYLTKLLDALEVQKNKDVEVIVVDDGSKEPISKRKGFKVVRKENGGVSSARNKGLDLAKGEYIAFIDADDMIAENYISRILEKIDEGFDFLYLSWKMKGLEVKIKSLDDKFPATNLCCWNRVYKRSLIGTLRFNENKTYAEDAEFIKSFNENGKKKAIISEIMYYYNSETPNSLTKRVARGEYEMKRVIYYLPHVTKDMDLLEEFKELNKTSEIILVTKNNEQPELEQYAMVIPPQHVKGTELRGEQTTLFEKIKPIKRVDVVIWTAVTFKLGGIETWIYNFCKAMSDKYNILVLYDTIDAKQRERLEEFAEVMKRSKERIACNTVIVSRITDKVPDTVTYKQKVQMVHACRLFPNWTVPAADKTIYVSEASKKSFEGTGEVIQNMVHTEPGKTLMLVSATRLSTKEKGEKRIYDLAEKMRGNGIHFLWLIFADKKGKDIDGIVWMQPTLDIQSFIKKADYLVQLSDAEGFCYSLVESLSLGTPVITTPIEVLDEIGVKDKENGYVIPFDVKDADVKQFLNIPKFTYEYDNETIKKEWTKILGHGSPKKRSRVSVEVLKKYYDTEKETTFNPGEIIKCSQERAEKLEENGVGVIKK